MNTSACMFCVYCENIMAKSGFTADNKAVEAGYVTVELMD
jgi:hypothetical protein